VSCAPATPRPIHHKIWEFVTLRNPGLTQVIPRPSHLRRAIFGPCKWPVRQEYVWAISCPPIRQTANRRHPAFPLPRPLCVISASCWSPTYSRGAMLRGRSAVAFASSVSGSASSRCLLGLWRRLSPLLSLPRWTAVTACSLARLLEGLQSVLNAAARLICNRRKYDHVTPLIRDVLHWLPVPFRIEYKLYLLVFLSLHGAAPEYLSDCCIGTHSSASGLRLRSLEKTDLLVHEDEDALWRSCFLFRRSSMLEQSPFCYSSCWLSGLI